VTTVFSYGAGVQSRAILQLVKQGRWPKPDLVVFADTKAEPAWVYTALEEDRALCERLGIELVVAEFDLPALVRRTRNICVPAFTLDMRGGLGMLTRQCTGRAKVEPVQRVLRRHLKATRANPVELWLGISTDEITRAKPSRVLYATHRWPLVELNLSRADCEAILNAQGITASKSACTFCPYGWGDTERANRLRTGDPAGWALAVEMDALFRNRRLHKGCTSFVHPARVPLEEAVTAPATADQLDLWGNECEGVCGL
jgi:hypothetical protein